MRQAAVSAIKTVWKLSLPQSKNTFLEDSLFRRQCNFTNSCRSLGDPETMNLFMASLLVTKVNVNLNRRIRNYPRRIHTRH